VGGGERQMKVRIILNRKMMRRKLDEYGSNINVIMKVLDINKNQVDYKFATGFYTDEIEKLSEYVEHQDLFFKAIESEANDE
jgi:hypothetical protein